MVDGSQQRSVREAERFITAEVKKLLVNQRLSGGRAGIYAEQEMRGRR